MAVEYTQTYTNWYVNYDRSSPYFGRFYRVDRETNEKSYASSIIGRLRTIKWSADNQNSNRGVLVLCFVDIDTGEEEVVSLSLYNFITYNVLNSLLRLINEHGTFLSHNLKLSAYTRYYNNNPVAYLSLNKPSVENPNSWNIVPWFYNTEELPKMDVTNDEFTGKTEKSFTPIVDFWRSVFIERFHPILNPTNEQDKTSSKPHLPDDDIPF